MEYRFLWFVSTCNNDFEANSTSLMSLWANIKFFPEPTGELYGWLLATLVLLKYLSIFGKQIYKGLCKDYFGNSLSLPRPYIY